MNENGDVEWHHILDQEAFPDAMSYSICIDPNENYYIAGYYDIYYPGFWLDENGFVAKYNCNGDYIWGKSYGTMPQHETDSSFNSEWVYDIVFYDENKLVIVGGTNYCPENELKFMSAPWIFAIDSSGNLLWEWKDCADTVHMHGQFKAVTKSDDGKIFAAGILVRARVPGDYTQPADNLGFLATFNENGDLVNRRTWNFLKNVSEFHDIKKVDNNLFAVSGYTADTLVYAGDKKERLSLILFDSDLHERFQYNINVGGGGGYSKISIDNDTNIFLVGITYPPYLDENTEKRSDMLIAKFNKNAEIIWKKFVGEDNFWYQSANMDVVADNDGGASFCSMLEDFVAQTSGSYLYKVNEFGEGDFSNSNFPYPDDDEYIIYNNNNNNNNKVCGEARGYPNPAHDYIIIELTGNEKNTVVTIFNLFGKEIINKNIDTEHNTIDVSMLKPGIYLLKTQSGLRSKFMKL